jgi:GNAT superfamily N-acetyltransferase
MVDPKRQGQGIARDLMQFAERWTGEHGYGAYPT